MALGWISRTVSSPSRLRSGCITYDADLQQIIGIEGDETGTGALNVHTWNGSTFVWTLHATTNTPSPRAGFTIAHDPVAHRILLWGGQKGDFSATYYELWSLNTTTWVWTQLTFATTPQPNLFCAWVYDPVRDHFLLFGGIHDTVGGTDTRRSETYIWNRTDFALQSPTTNPGARVPSGWCWDASTSKVMITGGTKASGPQPEDTWTYGTDWTQNSSTVPTTAGGDNTPICPYGSQVICYNNHLAHTLTWNSGWTDLGVVSAGSVPYNSNIMAYDVWSNEPVMVSAATTYVYDIVGGGPPDPPPDPDPATVHGKLAYYHDGAWHVTVDLI